MKLLVLALVVVGGVYVAVHFGPNDLKAELSSSPAGRWIMVTLPSYLREKLSMPENPIAKRKVLLDELTQSLSNAKRDLEKAIPVNGKIPDAQALKSSVAKAESAINATQLKIEELKSANFGEGIFRKAALGIVDKIFPAPSTSSGQAATTTAVECIPVK